MKTPKFLAGLLALAFASPAFGLTFEITGATAFRRATIESINALYVANGGAFRYGHDGANAGAFNGANVINFEGTITGLPGTTVIRCSFNGSIEGLRAIAQTPSGDARYLKLSTLTIAPVIGGANQFGITNNTANTETAEAEMAFSDTDKAISPYAATPMVGSSPGVVVFGLVVSEGANAITNVTSQQYNSLLTNGYVKMSMFTGLAGHDSRLVFCTGRNDGSGTRSSYLAEMGFGVANTVQQYLVVGSEGNLITAIQSVPAGGTNDTDLVTPGLQLPAGSDIATFDAQPLTGGFQQVTQLTTSASTVWGQDVAGNGGAFSGSVLRGHLGLLGSSVTVFDSDGFDLFGAPQTNIGLVSWISLNDAVTARVANATIAAYNGVSLAVNAGTNANELTAADKEKIYDGTYTAWNFQQFYRRTTASANTTFLYNQIFTAVSTNLGTAGLRNIDMKVGRTGDGGVINPIF